MECTISWDEYDDPILEIDDLTLEFTQGFHPDGVVITVRDRTSLIMGRVLVSPRGYTVVNANEIPESNNDVRSNTPDMWARLQTKWIMHKAQQTEAG